MNVDLIETKQTMVIPIDWRGIGLDGEEMLINSYRTPVRKEEQVLRSIAWFLQLMTRYLILENAKTVYIKVSHYKYDSSMRYHTC